MPPSIQLKANDTILFIGDSITSADRHRQAYTPLGFGYVHFAGNLLVATRPELNLRIINTGISGDTVVDLMRRWQADCIAHRPNVVSILVGINDVWQLAMEPDSARTASPPAQYELTYRQLLAQARERCDCRFVLMEPFLFCGSPHNEVYETLGPYLEIVRRLASEYEGTLVPLQAQIDRLILEIAPEKWSSDSVHPYLWAHAWIAQRWLQATGW